MSFCDMCGSTAREGLYVVELDRAVLQLCERCYRSYGSVARLIKAPRKAEAPKQPQRPPTTKQRPPTPKIEYEVVEDFPTLIRTARESMGMSRDALARTVGVKESVLRRIESGQLIPDEQLARRLERVLGVKLLVPAEHGEAPSKAPKRELTLGDIVEIREDDDTA